MLKTPFFVALRVYNSNWSGTLCGSTATLTMLWIKSLSITGQTHGKLTSICQIYRAYAFMCPAAMLVYWNKTKCLHKKRVELPRDWFGTPTWRSFHYFVTPIWLPWRYVYTLHSQRTHEAIFISVSGEPVKVLVSIFITSLGGLDEREMVSRVH